MVQATLLRSLIFSSVFCMVLCLDNAPTPPPKDGLFPDAAASKDSITNSTAIPTLGSSMGSNSTHQPDSSTIPGVLSADGKCTCPGVPPVSGGPPAINSSDETGSTSTPGPADNATAVSTNDTSSTSFIKAPTNLCLLAISAVVGFNSLIA